MTPEDRWRRAERFSAEGPRALAWMTTRPLVRWGYCLGWVLSGLFLFGASCLPWGPLPMTWDAVDVPRLADTAFVLGAAFAWIHAWMLAFRNVCWLPCNQFHPNVSATKE